MERSFKKEAELLKLGAGQTFHGEGILAVTKALLQSGVSYVGGYQGAPVSHMMDVLNDARDIMVDCYNTRCWTTWKRSEGAKVDADPPGAPATAPDPRKADAQ